MRFTDIKPGTLAEDEILVRVFGEVEIENRHGRIRDSATRPEALTWLTLKYLLVNSNRDVEMDELLDMSFFNKQVTMPDGALRTRLSRTRALLKPLKLNHLQGLLLFGVNKLRINPDYSVISDEQAFNTLMWRLKKTADDEPKGLELCTEALEIMRGVYMGYTVSVDWLEAQQKYYREELVRLCFDTLSRMRALGDDSACGLVWRRAMAIAPEAEGLHKAVISFMVERGLELELLRYVSQLAGKGARWLEDFAY